MFVFTVSLSWSGIHAEASAQDTNGSAAETAKAVDLPNAFTTVQIDQFIALLPDKDARALLRLSLIESVAEPVSAARSSTFSLSEFLEEMRNGSSELSDNFSKIIAALPKTGEVADHAFLLLTDLEGPERMWLGVLNLVAMIVFAVIGGYLVRRLFGGVEKQFLLLDTETRGQKVKLLVLRAAVEMVGLVTIFFTGQLVSLLYFDRFDPMRLFLLSWFGSVCVFFLARTLGRLIISPYAANLRLTRMSDRSAINTYYAWVWALTIAAFTTLNMAMFTLLGVPAELLIVWQLLGGAMIVTVVVVFIKCRSEQAVEIDLSAQRSKKNNVEQTFALLKFFGYVLLYALWVRCVISQDTAGAVAAVIVVCVLMVIRYLDLLQSKETDATSTEGFREAKFVSRTISAFFGVFVVLAFAQAAGLNIYSYSQTATGQSVKWAASQIVVILVVSLLVWAAISSFIRRHVEGEGNGGGGPSDVVLERDDNGAVTSRIGTVLPLFRKIALAAILATSSMFVLSALGINIGPLIAGAGVIGIAVGFGAQTLVKDIFSGIFFLIDDAFRVGEYVETGSYSGTVEKISIRSMQLRHHRGAIHTVPFGELRAVTNHNRDWVIYKQDFELPYEADIGLVRQIIEKVGQDVMEDPVIGPKMISPVRSLGVKRVENGALIIGTEFTCKPREQWVIRQYVYQLVRDRLYESGIQLAHRRVQIEMPEATKKIVASSETNTIRNSGDSLGLPASSIAAAAALTILDYDERAKLAATEFGENSISVE